MPVNGQSAAGKDRLGAMSNHRMSDAEYSRSVREGREPDALVDLREQLAALDRITARHPELADHNAKRRERIEAEIAEIKARDN